MKRLLVLMLLFVVSSAFAQDMANVLPTVSSTPCGTSPVIEILGENEVLSTLGLYGYNLHQSWNCVQYVSPWLSGASAIHMQVVSANTDDSTSFTLIRVSGRQQIWVIPTVTGMLEVGHIEEDPHNLAAFNAILHENLKTIFTDRDYQSIAVLYLTLIHHNYMLSNDESIVHDRKHVAGNDYTVTVFEGKYPSRKTYIKWDLTFSMSNDQRGTRLIDVSREIVRAGGPHKR